MIRRTALSIGLSALLFAGVGSAASAETATVGQLFTPAVNCAGPFTYLVTRSPGLGASYVIPFDGVITSWAWHAGQTPVTGLKLKVGHAVDGGQFVIDAEAPAGTQTPNTATSYPANIPVRTGQIIGIAQNGGSCTSPDAGYEYPYFTGDVPPSPTPMTPFATNHDNSFPVQVTVTRTTASQSTGQRAAALAKCKAKAKQKHWSKQKLRKCKRKARKLPV